MATRYNSYDSRSSSAASSFDLTAGKPPSSSSSSSRAIVRSDLAAGPRKQPTHLAAMVKKFMDKSSSRGPHHPNPKQPASFGLVIPADAIAGDLLKKKKKGNPAVAGGFVGLQKKLFGDGKKKKKEEVKALTELKVSNGANTRTLAMVLRSERELLSSNKELEEEVLKVKSLLEDKNKEVEKLKDLCLKQREEIKALKSAVLFPEDSMNCQLQEMLERQGKELVHAKQLIPTLQRQVTSLTDQLQYLAEDLAEVKADKFGGAFIPRRSSSPRTPTYDHEQAANSLEFSSCEPASPGSPDDMFLKDLNPCLTPYYSQTRSKEFEHIRYDSPLQSGSADKSQLPSECGFISRGRKMSKSSDCYQTSNTAVTARAARRSEDIKGVAGKHMHQRIR